MRASFGALLLFLDSTAKASTDHQLSSKEELSLFFDRIQRRLESYAILHYAGVGMSTVMRPPSVENKYLESSAAPFYVVRGYYSDDNCQDLEVAIAWQHGTCMPYADAAWTMVSVDGDTITTGIFTDSTCTTESSSETSPSLNICQMRTKMYLSTAEEFAGNSQGIKGRFHFGREPADGLEITFAKLDVCLRGVAKITDSGTNVTLTMFRGDNCAGAGKTSVFDKHSCVTLPYDDYFFCFDV